MRHMFVWLLSKNESVVNTVSIVVVCCIPDVTSNLQKITPKRTRKEVLENVEGVGVQAFVFALCVLFCQFHFIAAVPFNTVICLNA